MKWISSIVILLAALSIVPVEVQAQPAADKASLDDLIDWNNPWSLTPDKVRAIAEAIPHKKSVRAYEINSAGTQTIMNLGGYYGGVLTNGKLSLFGGRLRVEGIQLQFAGDKLIRIDFCIGQTGSGAYPESVSKSVSKEEVALLKSELSKCTGDTKPVLGTRASVWQHPVYRLQTSEDQLDRPKRNNGNQKIDIVQVGIEPHRRIR